jgi:hypothetical protein
MFLFVVVWTPLKMTCGPKHAAHGVRTLNKGPAALKLNADSATALMSSNRIIYFRNTADAASLNNLLALGMFPRTALHFEQASTVPSRIGLSITHVARYSCRDLETPCHIRSPAPMSTLPRSGSGTRLIGTEFSISKNVTLWITHQTSVITSQRALSSK